jgi:ABC-2 type transport system ATP-binding protein
MMKNEMAVPAPATDAVRVADLQVVRGGRQVLRDVRFTLPRGCVAGLLGPSGCGKTTLIRALVGVQQGVHGTVEVLGRPAGSPPLRSRVGYVTQAPSVYPDLTVHENLRYFAAVLAAPADDVDRVISEVDLRESSGSLVAELSGGQRARVSLATALLGTPELLVLDEPTVGLDPVLRRDLWAHFAALAARGVTLLVSSHVMDEASRCERLLLLHEGVLVADEPPGALVARTEATDLESAFLRIVDTVTA